jgi:hypothetical protein
VLKDQQARRGLKDRVVHKVHKVLKEDKVHKVPKVLKVL